MALAAFLAFVRREQRVASPIVQIAFFRSLGFVLINLANVLISLSSFSVLLFVPYFLVRFTALPLGVAGAVLAVVVRFQFGSRLITGGANSRLLEFSEGLAGYIHQIIRFLCFNSDEHPYPLGAWPQAAAPAKSDSTTRTATRSTRSRKKSPPPAPPVEEQPEGSTDG